MCTFAGNVWTNESIIKVGDNHSSQPGGGGKPSSTGMGIDNDMDMSY